MLIISILSRYEDGVLGGGGSTGLWHLEVSSEDYNKLINYPEKVILNFNGANVALNINDYPQWYYIAKTGSKFYLNMFASLAPSYTIDNILNIKLDVNDTAGSSNIHNFSIPQPILTDINCEYFKIRYRKIAPAVENWLALPDTTSNQFSLTLDSSSTYEIESIHHCCNGDESLPTTVSYNTGIGSNMIYITLSENIQSDTCSSNANECRNCQITRQYILKFFSDEACNNPVVPPAGMKVRLQEKKTGTYAMTPYSVTVNTSNNEFVLFSKVAIQFTCNNGNQIVIFYELNVLDGTYETQPYKFVKKQANSPTITEISNTTTGPGGKRTQSFRVGEDVIEGNKYNLAVYGVTKTYTASAGDTARSVVFGLYYMIISTTEAEWRQANSAPVSGTMGFPPNATWSKDVITIVLNHQNQFAASSSAV